MKTIRFAWFAAFFLCAMPVAYPQIAPHQARAGQAFEKTPSSSGFEPLDTWKTAVVSGDKAALAALYMTAPAARTKTPQGETLDPAEEPAFWSSLRPAGLSRFDLKVLEVKNVQPGVKAFVLRCEVRLQTRAGEKSGVISGSQVWVQRLGDWRVASSPRSDLTASPPLRLPHAAKPNTQLYPDPE